MIESQHMHVRRFGHVGTHTLGKAALKCAPVRGLRRAAKTDASVTHKPGHRPRKVLARHRRE